LPNDAVESKLSKSQNCHVPDQKGENQKLEKANFYAIKNTAQAAFFA
jgi:hypothetical protein